MNVSDDDFSLTLEQLIKAVKCILYKFNLMQRKNTLERVELRELLLGKLDLIEQRTKSNVQEINTFLHQMHFDFEQFVSKHKREHTALNERVLKVAEASETVVGTVLQTKAAVE